MGLESVRDGWVWIIFSYSGHIIWKPWIDWIVSINASEWMKGVVFVPLREYQIYIKRKWKKMKNYFNAYWQQQFVKDRHAVKSYKSIIKLNNEHLWTHKMLIPKSYFDGTVCGKAEEQIIFSQPLRHKTKKTESNECLNKTTREHNNSNGMEGGQSIQATRISTITITHLSKFQARKSFSII